MSTPAHIASAARARLQTASGQIGHSLRAIARGRPGDAEPDDARRSAVVQVRNRVPLGEARRIARLSGPEAVWAQTIDFVDVAFFARGLRASRAVCRISTRDGQGIGTGFLISPGLLITNNHVIGSQSAAHGLLAEFDFERDLAGMPLPVTRFALAPERLFITDDRDDLDFSLVAIGTRVAGSKGIESFGFLALSGANNKHALGDVVNIIQHPDGRMKEAVVRENQLVSRPKSGTVLHYVADTEPGSSGAPVFNVLWDVVALHHWGGPHRELLDERGSRVPRSVNEGIRTSAIVADLQTRRAALGGAARLLLDQALKLGVDSAIAVLPEATATTPRPAGDPAGISITIAPDGTATWQIPLAVSVRLGHDVSAANTNVGLLAPAVVPPRIVPAAGEAKLELDADYAARSGYDPAFLPSVRVPLPRLSAAQKRDAARNNESEDGEDPRELKYEHFSVVMNGKRRLAFFTATNIDGTSSKDVNRQSGAISDPANPDEPEAEAAEVWFTDRRISAAQQTPPDFYSGQTAFDANGQPITDKRRSDHRNRMFQQGHLTRRQDPLWGTDEAVVRAHADTFHVTNRAPQVGYFNMGTRKRGSEAAHAGGDLHWRALEDFVLQSARADQQRISVFTGPIFDAELDFPWSRGRADMKGFKAPRAFWKLLLRCEAGQLCATAFLADQSPLIDFVPELLDVDAADADRISFDKVQKYQVSVLELARRTGLDFGEEVVAADSFVGSRGQAGSRRVERLDQVALEPRVGHARSSRKRAGDDRSARRRAAKAR